LLSLVFNALSPGDAMLDTLNLDLQLDKSDYKQQMKTLMGQLRQLQQRCYQEQLPVVIVLEGWAAAGKGAIIKKGLDCMDPRGFQVHPIWPPTPQEQQYPLHWRFWQDLPARGQVVVFYHSWYTHVLEDRLLGRVAAADVPMRMRHINALERQLVDDGVAIAKFWIHLSKKELKKRLKKYAKDPLEAWRVRPEDWTQHKQYDAYTALAEEMLAYTSTGPAPWTLVEGDDKRWPRVKVWQQVAATLTEALDRRQLERPPAALPPQTELQPAEPDHLARVDLSLALKDDDYDDQLRQAQVKLYELQQKINQAKIPVLAIFEGWDAAGKGGAIKRLTTTLDPRSYQVHPFAAPTDEEKAHHYLWRFWRRLPPAGKIGIFDRSWYGRVMVERVEGFATEDEWRRAYQEINEFEAQLTHRGYVLLKFWIHISPEEQLRRFEARKDDPFKQHKLTDEDWRNRERWNEYHVAVNQMIQRTHTPTAPWTVVAGDDKQYARVKVIQTVVEAIKHREISSEPGD
jgi:polyphosphate:AMP phosphotransferase